MKSYVALFAGIGLGIAVASTPLPVRVVSLAAAQDAGHEQHQQGAGAAAPGGKMKMGNMMASEAKLEELVKKMNDAKGEAKTDAIAEVVTALVEQHRTMHGMMAGTPAQAGK
jgi:hypothetical protein